MKWLRFSLVFIILLGLVACPSSSNPPTPNDGPKLELGPAGVVLDGGKLLVAIPIENKAKEGIDADDVKVSALTLDTKTPLSPATFPVNLGLVGPDITERKVLQLRFEGAGFNEKTPYLIKLTGTYVFQGKTFDFSLEGALTLPPGSPGSAESETVTVAPETVDGAPFEHFDPERQGQEPNEGSSPPIPTGELRGTLAPTEEPSSFGDNSNLSSQATPVQLYKNTAFADPGGARDPIDLSGASHGDLVFGGGNTFGVYSTDGGNTFTNLDITKIFPSAATADSGGLCCDEIVQYIPKIDRFIWLMQDWNHATANTNKVRIASASPQDIVTSKGTKWTYWDLSSATFNLGANWIDYPNLSVGENFLYLDINRVGGFRLVVRMPLNEIKNGQTLNMNYFTGGGGIVAQNLATTAYWASHLSTSKMRVYEWPESSGSVSWHDVNVNSWPNIEADLPNKGAYISNTPGGLNWLGGLNIFPGSILSGGATRRPAGNGHGEELWFAWTANSNNNFPHIHVQIAKIEPGTWKLVGQTQIWNPEHAWAYPALATLSDSNATVGVSIAWGGNKYFGNHAVGFPGDPTLTITGTSAGDIGAGRWGDYYSLRPQTPGSGLFSTFGYNASCDSKGKNCGYQPRYILFGASGQPLPKVDLVQNNVTVNYKVPMDLTKLYKITVPGGGLYFTTITSDVDGKIDTAFASNQTFKTQGVRHITIKVQTQAGLSDLAVLTLTAVNTAPSITDLSAPTTIGLGVGWALNSAVIAPDPNELTGKLDCSRLKWSVTGSDLLTTETASNFGCDAFVIFGAEGSRAVSLTATDPEGLSVSKTFTVAVTKRPDVIPPTPKFIRVVNTFSSTTLQPGDRVVFRPLLTASVDVYNPDSAPLEYSWALFGPFGAFGFDLGTSATASVALGDSKYNSVDGDPYCSDDGDNNLNTCRARFRVILKSNGATVGVKEFPFIIDYTPPGPR